jgi:hypothetical protein
LSWNWTNIEAGTMSRGRCMRAPPERRDRGAGLLSPSTEENDDGKKAAPLRSASSSLDRDLPGSLDVQSAMLWVIQ